MSRNTEKERKQTSLRLSSVSESAFVRPSAFVRGLKGWTQKRRERREGGRERERGVRHPAAAPPQKHLSIPLLRGSEGGSKGKGVLRMGNFNQATAVAAEWSGVARRGRGRERERVCVRVEE